MSGNSLAKSKVTVLIWPSEFGQYGHSALRVLDEKGAKIVYASFWPGVCASQNKNKKYDSELCHKDTSHLHTWDNDSYAYDHIPDEEVDLDGLDILAIKRAYDAIETNVPKWTPSYNCNDVTLLLLEEGGFFQSAEFNHYSLYTLIPIALATELAVSIHSSTIVYRGEVHSSPFRDIFVPIISKVRDALFKTDYLNAPNPLQYGVSRLEQNRFISSTITSIIVAAGTAFVISYSYSFAVSSLKTNLPCSTKKKIAKKNAYQSSVIASSIILAELGTKRVFSSLNYKPRFYFPSDLIFNFVYMPIVNKRVPRVSWGGMLAFPIFIGSGLFLASKFFKDTTTTPKQVLDIVKTGKQQIDAKKEMVNKGLLSRIRNNSTTILGISGAVGAVVALGFFAYRCKNPASNSVVQSYPSNTFSR